MGTHVVGDETQRRAALFGKTRAFESGVQRNETESLEELREPCEREDDVIGATFDRA